MTAAPRALFDPGRPLAKPEMRLLGYLFGKRLLGEEVTDDVTLQRLVDMTRSVAQARADIPARTDVHPDVDEGDVAYRHAVANELRDEAIEGGVPHTVASAAAAATLGAGACDHLNDALLVKHAARLMPGEMVQKVRSDTAEGPHVFSVLASAVEDGRPKVLGDPLLGARGQPEFACLEQDARYGQASRQQMAWAGFGSATTLQGGYTSTRDWMARHRGQQLPGLVARARQDFDVNPAKLWNSLPMVRDDFAQRARAAVEARRADDPGHLTADATAFGAQLLGAAPPEALVRRVIDEAGSLDRLE